MNESVLLLPTLHALLDATQTRLQTIGGISHDEFLRQIDAQYDNASTNSQGDSDENEL